MPATHLWLNHFLFIKSQRQQNTVLPCYQQHISLISVAEMSSLSQFVSTHPWLLWCLHLSSFDLIHLFLVLSDLILSLSLSFSLISPNPVTGLAEQDVGSHGNSENGVYSSSSFHFPGCSASSCAERPPDRKQGRKSTQYNKCQQH